MYINSKILLSLLLASDVLSCVCVSFDRVRILFVYALNMFVYILSIFYVSVNCLYTLENILNVVCVGHRQRATRYTWLGVSIMSFHTLRCVSRLAWMYSVTYVYTLRLRIYARMWLVWWLVYAWEWWRVDESCASELIAHVCVYFYACLFYMRPCPLSFRGSGGRNSNYTRHYTQRT